MISDSLGGCGIFAKEMSVKGLIENVQITLKIQ
jgi:hypothetical protein